MIEKCCRTCKYYENGQCTHKDMGIDAGTIYSEYIEHPIDMGYVLLAVSEVMGDKFNDELLDNIINEVRHYFQFHLLDKSIEFEPEDERKFYCYYYE